MNITKIPKSIFARNLLVSALLILCSLTVPLGIAQAVYAVPLPTVFAVESCTLPDGSGGTVAKYTHTDNTTCCPSNTINGTVNGQGQADAVSCFYGKYLNPLIALLAGIVGVIVVIGIVFGAIEFITSNGDPQRAASGKKRITSALLALGVFLLLYAFLQFLVPGGLLNAN